ncbi:MAG: hypothetical protein DMG97_36585 [Acidobacteria bacterium]|nr:MAG: hypothetical protein DMG97_36585 [Acidobacteriota bacterium]
MALWKCSPKKLKHTFIDLSITVRVNSVEQSFLRLGIFIDYWSEFVPLVGVIYIRRTEDRATKVIAE